MYVCHFYCKAGHFIDFFKNYDFFGEIKILEHKIFRLILSRSQAISIKMFQIEQAVRELNSTRYTKCGDIVNTVCQRLLDAPDTYTTR